MTYLWLAPLRKMKQKRQSVRLSTVRAVVEKQNGCVSVERILDGRNLALFLLPRLDAET